MQLRSFYGSTPDLVNKSANQWCKKHKNIKIVNTLQNVGVLTDFSAPDTPEENNLIITICYIPEPLPPERLCYIRDEDAMKDFITNDCVVGDSYSINVDRIYERCNVWWKKNIYRPGLTQQQFNKIFQKHFNLKGVINFKTKKNKTVFYLGIKLKE